LVIKFEVFCVDLKMLIEEIDKESTPKSKRKQKVHYSDKAMPLILDTLQENRAVDFGAAARNMTGGID
jgi:hypothetical protein